MKTQIYFIPNNSLAIIFLVVLFFSSSLETLKAQKKDTLETAIVNIVKPYSPSISDAFKIRENPLKIDTSNFKKRKVTYSTFSIPVASTFNPAKGKVIRLEKLSRSRVTQKLSQNSSRARLSEHSNDVRSLEFVTSREC